MSEAAAGTLQVDRLQLLSFYDSPSPDEKGMTATAVNAVAGEELGLALLMRFFAETRVDAIVLPGPCSTGKMCGHRLDAWVRTPEVLYQVEVKNWSAHSFGGSEFRLDATSEEASDHRKRLWNEYWDEGGSTFKDPPAAKVLEKMRPPRSNEHVEPLIVFWVSLHPEGTAEPFFSVPLENKAFDRVHIFSMSTYLRGVTSDTLELSLPQTKRRLAVLDRIFSAGE
jgi:hypothetical protein